MSYTRLSGILDEDIMSVEIFQQVMNTLPFDEMILMGDAIFRKILDTPIRLRSEAERNFLPFWKEQKSFMAKEEARAKALARIEASRDGSVVPVPVTPAPPAPSGFKLSTPMIVGGASAALLVVALVMRGRKKRK